MSTLPSNIDEAILDKVRNCFCEALELDDDEVEWDSKILDDLGAESLDLLDVVFRLERAFDIQIPRAGLESQAKEVDGQPGEIDGKLTAIGAARLRELMPEVPEDEIFEGMKASAIATVFRVGTFYNIVIALLDQKNG